MDVIQAYIDTLPKPRRTLVAHYHALIQAAAPELAPSMGGTTGSPMIGYGPYHYRYASGREGDSFKFALANRKQYISFYSLAVLEDGTYLPEQYAKKLPGAAIGKSCISIKKPELLDDAVLRALVQDTSRLMPTDFFDATALQQK